MPLEAGTYVNDLDAANPLGTDGKSQGDNHLRLIKGVLKSTFPNADKAFRFPTTGTQTGSFSVTFPDDLNEVFVVDTTGGAVTVSLPDPTSGSTVHEDGFSFWLIKNGGTAAITVTPSGAQTILGAASYSMTVNRQFALFIWSDAANQWIVMEGNVSSLAYALTIALSGATPLTLRRTENNTSEVEFESIQAGSGAGTKLSRRLVGGGSNNIAQIIEYFASTAAWELAPTYLRSRLAHFFGTDNNIGIDPAGYVDIKEISAPTTPATDFNRLYALQDKLIVVKDDAGTVHVLNNPARAYTEYLTNADLSVALPIDDSIPQSNEGTEILSVAITLKRATSRIRARFQGFGQFISGDDARPWAAAMFIGGTANALAASTSGASINDQATAHIAYCMLETEHAPGAVGPHTISVRVGTNDGSTMRMNGSESSRLFGGVAKATLVLEEVFV